jgi:hypothetical protein
MKTINNSLTHLYGQNPLIQKGYCFFYIKKSNIKPSNHQELRESSSFLTFQLNKEDISKL